jgi:oligopeptide/dipeptide ABC transporter ATP-binding protein
MTSVSRPPASTSKDLKLLRIENLNISFRRNKAASLKVVSNLSIDINAGEIFCLAGESGCGKSITALSIMGLLPPGAHAEGKIFFRPDVERGDIDLLKLDESSLQSIRGKDIGMIFQEPMTSLNPVFSIGYQVSEVLMIHENLSRKEAMERTVELLSLVKIPSPEMRVRDFPHQLSGGMRQRVMIAMAVACNPPLLIADEPTTALDVTIQSEILALLKSIKEERGMSIILITHDMGIVAENADRVAIMYAGRILEVAPVRQIFQDPSHPYTIGLLESLPVSKKTRLKPIPGTVPSPLELPTGCKFSTRCRFRIDECEIQEPPLRKIGDLHFTRCIRYEDLKRLQ